MQNNSVKIKVYFIFWAPMLVCHCLRGDGGGGAEPFYERLYRRDLGQTGILGGN